MLDTLGMLLDMSLGRVDTCVCCCAFPPVHITALFNAPPCMRPLPAAL